MALAMQMICLLAAFAYVLSLHISNGFLHNASTDKTTLLILKSHVHSDILHQNWSAETPVCTWIGVTCALRHPRVTRLDISGLNIIRGSIPPELGQLSFLRYINVSYNGFQGNLPSELFGLHKLRVLDMAWNVLSGRVPSEVGKLKRLKCLNLAGNNFEGKVPKEIGDLGELRFLVLEGNKMSGTIPTEVGNLTMIQKLNLGNNHFTGSIPTSIFNLSTLELLYLQGNHLSGTLPSTMGQNLPHLRHLFLNNNTLTGTIPHSISNCTLLAIISLDLNNFTGPIPTSLGNLNSLTSLHMHGNALRADSSQELAFITSLTRCQHLQDIILSNNPLNAPLPTSIGNLSSTVRKIECSGCGIKGNIPNEIGMLSSLISLELGDNDLSGVMPDTLRAMHDLQGLLLGQNKISGPFPSDLCKLQQLYTLDLGSNEFSGPIPECVGNVTSLRRVYLSSNRFNLDIPSSIWNLKDLVKLDLSRNSFTGGLPQGIGDMKAIDYMDLSDNQLTGNISIEFGKMETLSFLSLARNQLEGQIPKSLGKMVNMESLDLSYNNLSGEIPTELENLKFLKYFSVSHNSLRGRIPSGGSFENLDYKLFESNEGLCGSPRQHVPLCPGSGSRRLVMLVSLSVIAPLSFVTIVVVLWMLTNKQKQSPDLLNNVTFHQRFSYLQIMDANDGFTHDRFLGSGSFGSVYKGIFQNGLVFAVKVFNPQDEDGHDSFKRECEMLSKLRHRNLTRVISACSGFDFKALILEYMPNGSLEDWLYPEDNRFLNTMQRLNIMIDVASALEYLHYGCALTPLLHCDLKPSNILLDEDKVGHVTDFGIAKFSREDKGYAYTRTLTTLGYIAPEYGATGRISSASDVYSYGILLMETFTAKRPCDDMFTGDMTLRKWLTSLKPNELHQAVDSCLPSEVEELQCVSSIIELAFNCTLQSPKDRVNIKYVLMTLRNIKLRLDADVEWQEWLRSR